MARWLRRTLRRYGIGLPFRHVVCPDQSKVIRVDADWRATVTVQSTLVFLDLPGEGDLVDFYPIDPDDLDSVIHESPDARELGRRRHGEGTLVYWEPRENPVRYAAYFHKRSWSSPGWEGKASLYTEIRCEMRTGVQTLEVVAPVRFDTALAFKRPRWRVLKTERSLVKYALTQHDSVRERRPVIRDNGQRVEWKVIGPGVGDRYICIAFTAEALEEWRQRLKNTSLMGRLRRLFTSSVPTGRRETAEGTRLFT
jgi:hypothetical protein